MEYIRQRILEIMEDQGISRKELAKRANLPYQSVNRYLSGTRRSVGMETLLNLASGLGVSLETLTMQQAEFSPTHNILNDKLSRLPEEERQHFINIFNDILDAITKKNKAINDLQK